MAIQQTDQLIIPSNPADREKLKGVVEEIALAYQRIADQQSAIKDILEHAKEDLGIPPKFTRKLAKTFYKNNFKETQSEYEDFETLYEAVIESNTVV
jgi:hypothetical protein